MEVHHHPTVEKKSFKEYFLEFLMIFLAVTMGFFAESIRERITDNSKEKEFITSMIEDAATDTANIHIAFLQNEKRITHLDSLCTICFNYNATPNEDAEIYRLYRYALVHPDFISPTERTLLQLKNSGGMRLIRKKAAVDSIIAYDDMAKKLADQQAYYERYQNESVNSSLELLNFKYYQSSHTGIRFKNPAIYYVSAQLLNRDKTKVIQLGNRITIYKGVVDFYNARLMEMNDHAINLINILKKEYHLENE
ncbi:MAG TPA: hypothetical protein VHZ50_05525 [Puia sp.]|jgi:hypothetical protein|nr:hypothetical protein [Puia sp.]